MNRLLSLFSITLLAASPLLAEVLTPAEALSRIEDTEIPSGARRKAAKVRQQTPAPMRVVNASQGDAAVYLFTPADGGLMIVSADSDAQPLLGYTDAYTPGDQLPPALEYMVSHYAAEISDLRAGKVEVAARVKRPYDLPAIEPVGTPNWNQAEPYNKYLPEVEGAKSVTGCVATAVAQALYTYKHPQKCNGGQYSYIWLQTNTPLTCDFDTISLDWDKMKTSYTAEDPGDEVAMLMKAIGYSSQMNYAPWSSGTYGVRVAEGLIRNFDFDCTLCYHKRQWYSLDEWIRMLHAELAGGHAIYFDGCTPDMVGAHAFTLDGYSAEGFFHVNWGWGGLSNGYFSLSSLDPAEQGIGGSHAGYSNAQGAILGLKPGATTNHADAPLKFYTPGKFRAISTDATQGSYVNFEGGLYNASPLLASRVYGAILMVAEDGTERYLSGADFYTNVNSGSGFDIWKVKMPNNLADGIYTIYPAIKNGADDKYYPALHRVDGPGYITAEVVGKEIYFDNNSVGKVSFAERTLPETAYPDTYFELTATITNTSKALYAGSLWLNYMAKGTQKVNGQDLGAFYVELDPGESVTLTHSFKFPANMSLGEYDILVYDDENRAIGKRHTLTIAERPPLGTPKWTKLRYANKARNNLTFELSVKSEGGLYANKLYIVLEEVATGKYYTIPSNLPAVLNENELTKVTITTNFSNGIVGERYKGWPYFVNSNNQMQQMEPLKSGSEFKLGADEISGIDAVESDETDGPAEYYDLSGRRVTRPMHGIYLQRTGSKVSKIIL